MGARSRALAEQNRRLDRLIHERQSQYDHWAQLQRTRQRWANSGLRAAQQQRQRQRQSEVPNQIGHAKSTTRGADLPPSYKQVVKSDKKSAKQKKKAEKEASEEEEEEEEGDLPQYEDL